jgi:hypothetical protein
MENNKPMRDNKPICKVDEDGNKIWRLNGQRHRIDGPAIEWANGSKEWCLNDKSHRIDGPAIEYCDGSKIWCLNGHYHRIDGPAIEWADGVKGWWLNGYFYSFQKYLKNLKKLGKSDAEIMLIALKYG